MIADHPSPRIRLGDKLARLIGQPLGVRPSTFELFDAAVSSGGASAGPSEEAALKRPRGAPRALSGNQSTTARAPAVNMGDSPTPSATRAIRNWPKPRTAPLAICATDQAAMPRVSISRGPTLSVTAPTGSWHRA